MEDDVLTKIEVSVKENEAIRMQWKEHMDRLKENLRVMNGINGETEDEVLENNSTFDSVHDRSTISNVALTERIEKLEEEIKGLQEKNFKLDCRVIECEQYSRRENLVISGIPENIKDTELEKTVISTLEKLSIYVNGKDISACHRLGRYNRNSRYPRRVIVRFVNRKIVHLAMDKKDRLWEMRGELQMNLRFYESLSSLNQEALGIVERLKRDNIIHSFFLFRWGSSKLLSVKVTGLSVSSIPKS